MRGTIAGLAIAAAACSAPGPRGASRSPAEQLAQCQVITSTGADLTRCLVVQQNWTADSALTKGLALQHSIDSAIATADSIERDAAARLLHASVTRTATAASIDSAFQGCVRNALAKAKSPSGGFETAEYAPRRERCGDEWQEARRRAGLPADRRP